MQKQWCLSRMKENALGTAFAVEGGNLMNCGAVVCPCRTSLRRERDEGALTAVIEFLSAFTLSLMILTVSFLAQLQMGSNDPDVDRLDRAGFVGIGPIDLREGGLCLKRTGLITAMRRLIGITSLQMPYTRGAQPGLMVNYRLDMDRISALHNVTEDGMAAGLVLLTT